jgi:hypothetical protein
MKICYGRVLKEMMIAHAAWRGGLKDAVVERLEGEIEKRSGESVATLFSRAFALSGPGKVEGIPIGSSIRHFIEFFELDIEHAIQPTLD